MSAFIVGKAHIDLLITAGLTIPNTTCVGNTLNWYPNGKHYTLTNINADEIGVILWAENYASVNHRYPDAAGELPGPADFDGPDVLTYTHQWIHGTIDPLVVLKAIACYEYQSCEHDGWETSDAKIFCASLTTQCIKALPGYDQAPWEFDDYDYFTGGPR